ncbi:hypothetical protein [uncultured Nostoc sp.]|uniref:hypothetical protein n=1 Tax=uncultured Nostoc sp. TaxID=340711 RepID=UPI0035C9AE23
MYDYLVALGFGEHFFTFRHEVKVQLETQLEALKQQQQTQEAEKVNYQLSPVS